MPETPMEILKRYSGVRSQLLNQTFREAVVAYTQMLGYPVCREEGPLGTQNILIGDPKKARFLVSAGNARSGLTAWLEILRTFPENQRQKVCFLLLDGKIGTAGYRKRHKAQSDHQVLIVLDHVGDGAHIRMFPTKSMISDRLYLTSLYKACGYFGSRDILVEEKGRPLHLPAKKGFPYAVTICAFCANKKRMHFHNKTRNTAQDATNVNILRAALTTYICCDEVNQERNMKK